MTLTRNWQVQIIVHILGSVLKISSYEPLEMSLSVFCAAMICLLLSDWAEVIAATHISPLSSGISSESIEEPPQLFA